MGVFRVRAGGETDRLVAGGEVDIEPGDQGVDEVVAADVEGEWGGECEVGNLAFVEVESQDCGWVGDDGLDFDGVDEGFGESGVLEG